MADLTTIQKNAARRAVLMTEMDSLAQTLATGEVRMREMRKEFRQLELSDFNAMKTKVVPSGIVK
jgi:hypothetical protein